MVGRKPRPLHIKLIEGEPNKDRLNFNEVRSRTLDDQLPALLKGGGKKIKGWKKFPDARKAWEQLQIAFRDSKLLKGTDSQALQLMCLRWAMVCEVIDQLKKTGFYVKTPNDFVQTSPALSIFWRATEELRRDHTVFGMTSADRQRLKEPLEVSSDDEMESLLTAVK